MIPDEVGILERDRANQLSEMMKRNQNSSPGTKAQSQGKTFRNRKYNFLRAESHLQVNMESELTELGRNRNALRASRLRA